MEILYQRCAGIDVHKDQITVAVRVPGSGPGGRDTQVRKFRAFYGVLREMTRWLASLGVTHVAMEATGIIRGHSTAVCHSRRRPALSVSSSVADGLSAGPSVTQIADRRAHLVTTPRRCRFCPFRRGRVRESPTCGNVIVDLENPG